MSIFQDFEGLLGLLKIAEELLFSFPLPAEVIKKYEFLRTKTFTKCRIPYNGSHIKRLQLEALSKLDKDTEKVINTSALEFKDIDLQNKLQQITLNTQKLANVIEKLFKLNEQIIYTCSGILNNEMGTEKKTKNVSKLLELPLKPFDVYENDIEAMAENYKKTLAQNEILILNKLQAIDEEFHSKTIYIKKLEQDLNENTNELNKTQSEIMEKYNQLQDKYVKEKNEYEKKIKEYKEEMQLSKTSSLNEARRAQMKEIDKIIQEKDMYQEQSEALRRQLDDVSSALQIELKNMHEDYEKSTQELTQSLTNKNKEIETSLRYKIEVLEKTLLYREKELMDEINKLKKSNFDLTEKMTSEISFYKNNSESLQNCFECISGVLEKVYKQHSDKNIEPGDMSNTLMRQIEFLDLAIEKLSKDNSWLVERISEVGKENETLKKEVNKCKAQETILEIGASNKVLQNFEASRSKLKQKISESIKQFPDTYSKLAYKYNNIN